MSSCITRGSKVGNDPLIELQADSTQNNQGTSEDISNMGSREGNNPSFESQESCMNIPSTVEDCNDKKSCMSNTTGTVQDFSDNIKYDVLLVKHSNHQVNHSAGIWIILGVTDEIYDEANKIIDQAFLKMEDFKIRPSSDNPVQQENITPNEKHIRKRLLKKQKYKWLENTKTGCHLILMIDGPTHQTQQPAGSSKVLFPAANNDFTRNLKLDNAELVPLEKEMKSSICDQYSGNWEGRKKSNKQDLLINLFQLCILLNQTGMAFNLWRLLEEQLSAAIGAVMMLKSMFKKRGTKKYKKNLKNSYKFYTIRAIDVLSDYHENDEKDTHDLLRTKWENWGNLTLLQLAVRMDHKKLVSQPAIQSLLSKVWKGKIEEEVKTWHILLSLILIPIFYLISFREEDENNSKQSKISSKNKVLYFYNAPVVTFWFHVFSYLVKSVMFDRFIMFITNFFTQAFLLLYAYVILFNFHPPPENGSTKSVSIAEFVLWAWVFILALDELYEIYQREHKGIATKLRYWITDFWNILDAVPILLFIIGLGLRLNTNTFQVSRDLLAISFMVYCWRILNILLVHEAIGPELIMVREMIRDVLFFLFILVIFQISYGVACQALLYPNETDKWNAIQGVFSKPYWQIYGELFLSEIRYNPTADEYSCSNKTAEIAAGYRRCPEVNWLVPVLSALYMLLSGVILLNLLVAVFTSTLKSMKPKDILYEFQRYGLVEMYMKRPPFVPPLSIFYYLWKLLCKVKMLLCKLTSKQSDESSSNKSSDCCEYAEPLVLESGKKDPVKETITGMTELSLEICYKKTGQQTKHFKMTKQINQHENNKVQVQIAGAISSTLSLEI